MTTIAYIVEVHRYPEQLARLVGRLAGPGVSLFVHIDRNVDDATHRALTDAVSSRPNAIAYFLPRHPCAWGSWGVVQAQVEGLRQIFRMGVLPDHVILVSGQDYPLRSQDEIAAFFDRHRGRSFIDIRRLPDYAWNRHGALDRFPDLPLPADMHPCGGSAWWALSGDCAAYVLGVADRATDLMRLFSGVGIPDEHAIQTIVGGSPFRDRIARLDGESVLGVHYIDWRRGPPKVLGMDDRERLFASPALFARKFDLTHDAAILDAIDERLDRGDAPGDSMACAAG